MRHAVIDVGSNSVRLMIEENGRTLYKKTHTTRIAEGNGDGFLQPEPLERTARAVAEFALEGAEEADEVFAFATAAVRSARNGALFCARVKELCGLEVDVLSGEEEALCGYVGACHGKPGKTGVIDVGGASTEIVTGEGNAVSFRQSVYVGVVSMLGACGQDEEKIKTHVEAKLSEFGNFPSVNFFAIGGTATTIAAFDLELEVYDPNRVEGHVITRERMREIADKLIAMTPDERGACPGIPQKRKDVIAGGAMLLARFMEKFSVETLTVSESDNLEGYLKLKGANG